MRCPYFCGGFESREKTTPPLANLHIDTTNNCLTRSLINMEKIQNKLLGRFGVVKLWQGIKVAEDENIQRIKIAAKRLGIACVELDWKGRLLDSPQTQMTADDLDFVIHLHFETPKAYDIYSFYTLWNPPQWFHDWGYQKFSDNLITHDDYLSCDGPKADQMIVRRFLDEPFVSLPLLTMYHSLSEPLFEPTFGELKLFYVGVNWERATNSKGRHHDLLVALDKKSLVKIYGPTELHGVRVWEGFKNYVGELPFDGVSCINAIHDAGVGLALSSEAHKDSEMVSNRIFEIVAAGSIVISDQNAFVKKNFGNAVLYIDTDCTVPEVITQIENHLSWIKSHRTEAFKKITEAQATFREKFSLDLSIKRIYDLLPERKSYYTRTQTAFLAQKQEIVRLYFCLPMDRGSDLENVFRSIKHQTYTNLAAVLLVDSSFTDHGKLHNTAAHWGVTIEVQQINFFDHISAEKTFKRNRGEIIATSLANDQALKKNQLVCFVEPHERIFSDHIERLIVAVKKNDGVDQSLSPIIYYDSTSNETRTHGVLWPATIHPLKKYPVGCASALFRWHGWGSTYTAYLSSLNKLALMALIDPQTSVNTKKPTVLIDTAHPWASLDSKTTLDQELCYMRDINPWKFEANMQTEAHIDEMITQHLTQSTHWLDRTLLKKTTPKQKRRIFFNLLRFSLIPHWIHKISKASSRQA